MRSETIAIAASLKSRGVKRLVYFHTDHFEPWRHVPGRTSDMALAGRDVETYVATSERLEFARRATLFLKSNVNFAVDDDRDLHRAAPEDRLGFVPRSAEEREIGRAILAPLVATGRELQLHIHHENFVWNGSLRDQTTRDYLQTPLGKALGPARLELAIRLNLDLLREDGGIDLDRWFFIHGHWALNASDPEECTVVREIELLMRNGCAGDFTQPAGRPHVDARINEPYLARPAAEAKGYDSAAADPISAAGAAGDADGRFFLWATELDHSQASVDIYSKAIARRAENPASFGLAQAQHGVLFGETLYVKTHGHSMAPAYWTGDFPFPHAHPGIQRELGTLFDAADQAGTEITFRTASEVYDEILSLPSLADGLARGGDSVDGSPMADQGVTVIHRDRGGRAVPPPPLPFRAPKLAQAGPWRQGPAEPDQETALPEIVSIGGESPTPAGAASSAGPVELENAASVIDAVASEIALDLFDKGESEGLSVTGYYVTRAREGRMLQSAERMLAGAVAERFRPDVPVWEIGCGLGMLTTLLAELGFRATGIDRNAGRLEVARLIAHRAAARGLADARHAKFLYGVFPNAVDRETGLAGSVALVTNLLGNADLTAQRRFIRGLRRFDIIIVDLQRFFTRRADTPEQAALIAMFREEGFPEPTELFSLGSDGRYVVFGRARLTSILSRQTRRIMADRVKAWLIPAS